MVSLYWISVLCLKATIEIMVVELGPPSFLSLHINNHADKYLWVALVDRERYSGQGKGRKGERWE